MYGYKWWSKNDNDTTGKAKSTLWTHNNWKRRLLDRLENVNKIQF